MLVPYGQVSAVGEVSVLCSTAMDAVEDTVRSRVKPVPEVSVTAFEEPNNAIIKSFAFKAVIPPPRTGEVEPPALLVLDAVPGYPAALSQTVKDAAGSSAPFIAIASPLAEVGVPLKVTVIVTDDSVPEATPCHSSIDTAPPPGLNASRAEASNVMPEAERLETVIEVGFSTTTTRIESGLEVVVSPVIVKVVPVLHVPVCFAFAFESMAGALPMLIL